MSERKPLVHPDHPKPITRRQFMSQGLIDAASLLMVPSLFEMVLHSKTGWAANCGASSSARLMPFLLFDCSGGAALCGNWVVGKKGGPEDFLKTYDRMGVPKTPQSGEPIDGQFGTPMYTNLSQLRAGLISMTSETTRTHLKMVSLCSVSQDDNPNNLLSPLILVSRAGLSGTHIQSGLGTLGSDSGGNSSSPMVFASAKPLAVSAVNDVLDALSYGPAFDEFTERQKGAVARALLKLTSSQVEKLKTMTLGAQFKELAECGYLKNKDYTSVPQGVDPRLNPICQTIYNLKPDTVGLPTQIPAIVYNVLQGNSGPGAITINQCDYHVGNQATGDAKDKEIGENIGRAVELASQLGKPLFFAVISDGSCYSDQGTRNWRGDSGTKGLAAIGYFNPSTTPTPRRLQLGHFTDGQGVERTTYIGNEPKRVAYSIFANYLNVNRKLGTFSDLVSEADFDRSQIDAHIVFD